MTNIVMVSGGFDPPHAGHIEMIQKASVYGDVIVLVNNDEWLMRKKGYIFMSCEERMKIMLQIKGVVRVYEIQSDRDDAVDGIKYVYHMLKVNNDIYSWHQGIYKNSLLVFANGGDRYSINTPEVEFCAQNGIALLWGLGDKIQSSSELVKKANEKSKANPNS